MNADIGTSGIRFPDIRRSERGASTLTYALVLPLFLLLMLGAFEIWRLLSIRQSMERGVYQAARYLSQHSQGLSEAERRLYREVAKNRWLLSTNPEDLELLIIPPDLTNVAPGDKLVLEARLPVHVGDLGFLTLFERGSPAWITLRAHSTTFVDITTRQWEPLDEGTAY